MAAQPRQTLFDALGTLPDPRQARGVRHPAQFLLAASVAAMLSDRRHPLAIAEWVRDQDRAVLRALGMTRYHRPCKNTFYDFFKILDITAFESLLAAWLEGVAGPASGLRPVSLDGKTLRGSARKHAEAPGVHLISAYASEPGCVLAQMRVDEGTNEHKTALALIGHLILERAVIVGDAAYCQRDLSEAVVARGGEYFWVVKDNQPELKEAIAGAFEAPVSPPGDSALAG